MSITGDVQSLLDNVTTQAVVRITSSNINGFVFDIAGDEETTFESEITDHYLETNSTVQDHIALRPRRYTLTGFIGELNDSISQSIVNVLSTVTGLNIVSPYLPQFNTQATQVYTQIAALVQQAVGFANNIANSANGVYALLTGASTSATRQQATYNIFYQLWTSQTLKTLNLCTVETAWDVLHFMAIERVTILQRDDNGLVSEFSVTFKEMRFVNTNVPTQNSNLTLGVQGNQPTTQQSQPVANMTQTPDAPVNTQGSSVDPNNTPVAVATQLASLITLGTYGGIT